MFGRKRVYAALAGGAIGAFEGFNWVDQIGQLPALGQLPWGVPVIIGAVVYGAMGFRYGILGFGFAVAMLIIDITLPPGLKEIAILWVLLFVVTPFVFLVWGHKLVPSPVLPYLR